ncbi:MAG: class I SAM-dependent methyltransferase [Hyphomicrobiaceae bacterium]|nr:MAG: class I SAM-dependent methyltransferase [Hyphomicrobiaceae bacterium]
MAKEELKAGADQVDRRSEGKKTADRLREEFTSKGDANGWFDACYRAANREHSLVPWAHLEPRPKLLRWLRALPPSERHGRALDIGCGLGDNAAALANAGYRVTAFDISPAAVEWAKERFRGIPIEWHVADLLSPPDQWRRAFDLVSEGYTLQSLREPYRSAALGIIGEYVKPGGRLLIICRGRKEGDLFDPPPWPLTESEIDRIAALGLRRMSFEEFFTDGPDGSIRHFLAEYRRSPT